MGNLSGTYCDFEILMKLLFSAVNYNSYYIMICYFFVYFFALPEFPRLRLGYKLGYFHYAFSLGDM